MVEAIDGSKLRDIRLKILRCSDGKMAAMLGIPVRTLRRIEDGKQDLSVRQGRRLRWLKERFQGYGGHCRAARRKSRKERVIEMAVLEEKTVVDMADEAPVEAPPGNQVPDDYAQRILQLRKHMSVTQAKFAALLGEGTYQAMISKWECGHDPPTLDQWILIATLEAEQEDRDKKEGAMPTIITVTVVPKRFDAQMRNFCERVGLRQKEFAALMGCSSSTVHSWLHGQNVPTPERWNRFLTLEREAEGNVVPAERFSATAARKPEKKTSTPPAPVTAARKPEKKTSTPPAPVTAARKPEKKAPTSQRPPAPEEKKETPMVQQTRTSRYEQAIMILEEMPTRDLFRLSPQQQAAIRVLLGVETSAAPPDNGRMDPSTGGGVPIIAFAPSTPSR